ncbi:MAG: glycosyltransferase [Ignavibacteriaceae bacterium]|nr:glycosyltransferase [Ignavibacteriaceae bacterium]
MNKLPITAISFDLQRETKLKECIDSVVNYVDEIIIVDSFSTDETISIAESYNIKVLPE